jgi:hypothetical protein
VDFRLSGVLSQLKHIIVTSEDVKMQEKTSKMHTMYIKLINAAQFEADAIKHG